MGRQFKKQFTIKRMRMKDIIGMLADVIYIMCGADTEDTLTLIKQLTDITPEELEFFNIIFPHSNKNE